jgi:uncharacterized membrane protein
MTSGPGEKRRVDDPGAEGATEDPGRDVHGRFAGLERLVDEGREVLVGVEERAAPAWRVVTQGEPRLPVSLAVVFAVVLMVALPARVTNQPRWLFPALAMVLLVGIIVANPRRIGRPSRVLRAASLTLIAVLSVANAASASRLILDLVNARGIRDPATLLLTGAAIWLTNILVFALWYWEFDRGGPAERAVASNPYPDFLFPQMSSPELAPQDWEPEFVDYFYTSFTNATAFSPTDVMPMSRWAKLTMLVQSAISLVTVVLVIARAVNILK